MEIQYTKAVGSSRTFSWCGQKWFAKNSGREKVGPGPSYFNSDNIEVGNDSSLKMWVKSVDLKSKKSGKDHFASAEVHTTLPLGYGLYQLDVDGSLTGSQWESLVLGFFTYDKDNASQGSKEIDIEIGTFGGRHASGGVFSNQNDELGGKQLMDISPSKISNSHKLTLNWLPNSIEWTLTDLQNNKTRNTLKSMNCVPSCEGALLHINLWQFNNIVPNGTEQSIVLRNFAHEPYDLTSSKLRYVEKVFFRDGINTFIAGKTYTNKKISIKASRHMTNVQVSICPHVEDVEASYPGNKEKASLNGDIEIAGGKTDFVSMTLRFLDAKRDILPVRIQCDQFVSNEDFLVDVRVKMQTN